MMVAFSGLETQSATLEIVRAIVAMTSVVVLGNGWLSGLGLLAFDLVSCVLSV